MKKTWWLVVMSNIQNDIGALSVSRKTLLMLNTVLMLFILVNCVKQFRQKHKTPMIEKLMRMQDDKMASQKRKFEVTATATTTMRIKSEH